MRLDYLSTVPRSVPKGRVLIHNRVEAIAEDQPPGANGFRAWADKHPPDNAVVCNCGWSGLPHYRVAAQTQEPPNVKGKVW
jgi:hypothetical protein